ncbi:MAG: 2-oxoglutarate dehydrogenase complex dihydrolipoyllysine-residue succinyltransferase [Thermodesulfobacteriota bacterium]
MQVELKVPEVGESVKEAILAEWYKKEGEHVEKDEPVFVIETDKVTLEVPAEESGVLHILVAEGENVEIGTVVGTLETEAAERKAPQKAEAPAAPAPEDAAEASEAGKKAAKPPEQEKEKAPEKPPARASKEPSPDSEEILMPSVRRLIREHDLDAAHIQGSGPGGRITKGDVLLYLESGAAGAKAKPQTAEDAGTGGKPETAPSASEAGSDEPVTRKRMSPIRKRIAEHLLAAKQETAMLTTFNEIDMSRVMAIRDRYKDGFYKKYDTRLGFMSFFIKAVVAALKELPQINARIEGDEIIYYHYYHIGIAIGAEKGLVVPVIRHADRKSFAELESEIVSFAAKVKENRLELSELEGGTFSITNGGIYGSLLSTPILNMPQSAILGMHKIEERPVAIDGEVVIRPMMYVAVSYDHRIVDGKDAVTFLRRIKEFVENLERIMMEI